MGLLDELKARYQTDEDDLDPDDPNSYPTDPEDPDGLAEVAVDVDRTPVNNERTNRLQSAQDAAIKANAPPEVQLPKLGQVQMLPGLKSDLVRQHIIKQAQQKQEDERSKLVQNVQDADSSPWANIFAGLAGFGAGVRHGDVGAAYKQAMEGATSGANRALSEYDKNQQLGFEKEDRELKRTANDRAADRSRREGEKWQQERDQYKNDNDPNSAKSQAYRQFLVKSLKITDPDVLTGLEGKSFSDLEKTTPLLTKQFDQSWDEQKHSEDLAERKKQNEATLALAGANLGLAQGAAQRSANADVRAARAAELAAEAARGKVENVETSSGPVNIKDDKEFATVQKVAGILNFRELAHELSDNGTLKQNVGLINGKVLQGKEYLNQRSPSEAKFALLRDNFESLKRQEWKTEPNGIEVQKRLSSIGFPKNESEIPLFLEQVDDALSIADPDGRYGEVVSDLSKKANRKPKATTPPPQTNTQPAAPTSSPKPTQKTEVKRQKNNRTGEVRIVYSDGSTEIVK